MQHAVRQSINPEVATEYGAVRFVKVESTYHVDVLTQRKFVDVSGLVPIDEPIDMEYALEFGEYIADSYDAEVADVLATISDHEAQGLPVLWIVATSDMETVTQRMTREARECRADHGRCNPLSDSEWERRR